MYYQNPVYNQVILRLRLFTKFKCYSEFCIQKIQQDFVSESLSQFLVPVHFKIGLG